MSVRIIGMSDETHIMRPDGMRVWGLTGGIGSGKSTIARIFIELGVPVVKADEIARNQMVPGHPVFDQVVAIFGTQILTTEGAIDRKALGEIAFADPAKTVLLNKITHSHVFTEIELELQKLWDSGHRLAFIEAAILVETGLAQVLDGVVVVTAPLQTRLTRVISRDKIAEKAIRDRIARQAGDETLIRHATFVVENTGTQNSIRDKTLEVLGLIQKLRQT